MKEIIYGLYDFEDRFYYDPNVEDNSIYTQIHEMMHYNLTAVTRYGVTNFIIEQLNNGVKKTNVSFKDISKNLVIASRHIHEATAVFYQYASIKYFEGEDRFQEEVKKLEKNIEYYGYFKYYDFLFGEHDLWDVLESQIVLRIAEHSLNGDLTNLPKGMITKGKKLRAYFTHPDEGKNYCPNKRFKLLLEAFKKLLGQYSLIEITDDILLREAGLTAIEFNLEQQVKLLEWLNQELRAESTKLILDKYIAAANDLVNLSDNPKDEEDIRMQYWHSAHPILLNPRYVTKMIHEKNFDFQNFELIMVIHNEKEEMDKKVSIIGVDVVQGINYLLKVSELEALKILKDYKNVILLFHQQYEFLSNNPNLKIVVSKKHFVYVDIPYINCSEFLETHITNDKGLLLTKFEDKVYYVFLKVKNSRNGVMFIPVAKTAINLVVRDIQNKKFNHMNFDEFKGNGTIWHRYDDVVYAVTQNKFKEGRLTFYDIK